jgi:hypothetical protein
MQGSTLSGDAILIKRQDSTSSKTGAGDSYLFRCYRLKFMNEQCILWKSKPRLEMASPEVHSAPADYVGKSRCILY